MTLMLLCASIAGYSQTSYHGKKISEAGAIPATQLAATMGGKDKMTTKVEGTVEDVCKMKGCWMKVKTGDGQTMRVMFKDYGFFVPKDIVGKKSSDGRHCRNHNYARRRAAPLRRRCREVERRNREDYQTRESPDIHGRRRHRKVSA